MLEGLEAVEVLYSNSLLNKKFQGRCESEFFRKGDKILLERVYNKKYRDLGDFVYLTDGEHGTAITTPTGFAKYYGARNVLNGILSDNSVEYISKEHHKKIEKSKLYPTDILISCVGANIGFAAIVPPNIGEANIVRNVALIRSKDEEILNEYLLSYFLSKYGKNLFIRMATGNAQPLVSLDYIKTIPVFVPSKNLQLSIQNIIICSVEKLDLSKVIYSQTEEKLLIEIGLKDFEPSRKSVNIKSFKDSFRISGRLDAEYFQKKYEEYENLIITQSHSYIKDEYIHVITTSKKDKSGYNYIEIGDVNVEDGSYKSNFVNTEDLPANAKILVQKGDILISNVRPYRGAVTIISTDENDLIVSGAFTVLRKNPNSIYNNEVLKVLLRSSVYKDWLLKFNVGTSYPVIKDEDVLNLPIPFVNEKTQKQIAELIEESFKLKNESERLLEVAKKAVEIAIETDDKSAIKFIKDNEI